MKKLVINLERRTDRRELFEEKNHFLEDYNFIRGVDGETIDMQTLIRGGWHIDTTWRDPFKNRKLQNNSLRLSLSVNS